MEKHLITLSVSGGAVSGEGQWLIKVIRVIFGYNNNNTIVALDKWLDECSDGDSSEGEYNSSDWRKVL